MPSTITLAPSNPATARVAEVRAPALAPNPSFGRALGHLEAGAWPQAFTELAALADDGHAASARIALMMVSRGGSLFGGHYRASAQDIARWRLVAG
jgi:hypothetical protein